MSAFFKTKTTIQLRYAAWAHSLKQRRQFSCWRRGRRRWWSRGGWSAPAWSKSASRWRDRRSIWRPCSGTRKTRIFMFWFLSKLNYLTAQYAKLHGVQFVLHHISPIVKELVSLLLSNVKFVKFKGSDQWEARGGIGKVADDWNWSRNVVIDVLLSFNLLTHIGLILFPFLLTPELVVLVDFVFPWGIEYPVVFLPQGLFTLWCLQMA